jgi:hypothetical protein
MTRKREPIDDIIDAFVWMEAQRRKKRGSALGALRGRLCKKPPEAVTSPGRLIEIQ